MGTLFPALVYSLCLATSALCAFLLGRSFHKTRTRMLFWSAICFALLAIVHCFVILDMLIFAGTEFRSIRLWLTVVAIGVLLFGFIWNEDA